MVVMILNLKTVDETLEITNTELRGSVVDEYLMAPPGGVLTARYDTGFIISFIYSCIHTICSCHF